MTPRDSDSVFVVRVEQHSAIVAEIDLNARRVRRALGFPGGLCAIDGLIEVLVVAAARKLLDVDPDQHAEFGARDRDRLRREVAAARIRLVDDESTTVVVRRGRQTVFVPLERSSVIAVLANGTAAVARGLTTLGAMAGSRVVELDGVEGIPGLLDALPGWVMPPIDSESHDLGSMLDSASWDPPVGDTSPMSTSPVPHRMALLRRSWPGAIAVALLLAVGGTAAAVNLSGRSAESHPATTAPRPDESLETAADRSATPSPAASATQTVAPVVPTSVATPIPKPPTRSTPVSGASNPGAGPAPGSSSPAASATIPPSPPPTDSPSPGPTPSDPSTPGPGSLG